MTDEQRKQFIKEQIEIFPADCEMGEFLRDIAKLQPCEDAISRQEVIEILSNYGCTNKEGLLFKDIRELPSVKPQQPCEDAISRQAVLDIITEQERLASDRVRDTSSSLGDGLHTWVNPTYTRYATQLSERSQFKIMIQTMPPVSTEKTGRWIESNGVGMFVCSVCNDSFYPMPTCMGKPLMKYCPFCGAKMEVKK